ncbi:hypothetical protein D3C87_2209340 [compost metagenome]
MSNTLKDEIMLVIARKKVVGPSSGTVIRRNCWMPVAPSIVAASYSSSGIFVIPARKIIIW